MKKYANTINSNAPSNMFNTHIHTPIQLNTCLFCFVLILFLFLFFLICQKILFWFLVISTLNNPTHHHQLAKHKTASHKKTSNSKSVPNQKTINNNKMQPPAKFVRIGHSAVPVRSCPTMLPAVLII